MLSEGRPGIDNIYSLKDGEKQLYAENISWNGIDLSRME